MEYASAVAERHAVCTKMSLMQVHHSTVVVGGRAVGELLISQDAKLLRVQLEGDLLGSQWQEC